MSVRDSIIGMTTVWDRRNPRVSYQVPVGVLDPAKQRLLNMISINLSRGGMFVDTPEELPIGKELVCNLPIGETEAMQLRARVAWHRPYSISNERRPRGVGIEFIDLSESDSEQLEKIVGDHEELSHAVRLQVEGMKGAINAQAQLTPQGIFFRSPLPFLQLNSQVDFAFDDDNGDQSYQGRIVDVKVQRDSESAVPRLQVEVELLSMGHEDNEIPCGLGSDAVYEVMHIDREDTERTAVDLAVDEAIDVVIDSGMHAMDRVPVHQQAAAQLTLAEDEEDLGWEFGDPALEHEDSDADDGRGDAVDGRGDAVDGRGDAVDGRGDAVDGHREIDNGYDQADDSYRGGPVEAACERLTDEFSDELARGWHEKARKSLREHGERASESDPILLVMPKSKPEISERDLPEDYEEDADEELLVEQVVVHDRRLWLGVGVIAAVVMFALFVYGSGSSTPTSESPDVSGGQEGSLLSEEDSAHAVEAERVRELIEGPRKAADEIGADEGSELSAQPNELVAEAVVERPAAIPANRPAVGGPLASDPNKKKGKDQDQRTPGKVATVPLATVPLAKTASAAGSSARKQTLGGLSLRENADEIVVQIPITGSLERAENYALAEPAGLAINLPYAQPSHGYHESLVPESEAVRRIWVRERLGGLHVRIFFKDGSPSCETKFEDTQIRVRCQR